MSLLLRICALIALLGLPAPGLAVSISPGPGDSAGFDELLHGAAFSYAEGDMLTASNSVHRALALQPGHAQAEALRELIEQTPPEESKQQEEQKQERQQQQPDQSGKEDEQQKQQDQEQPAQQQGEEPKPQEEQAAPEPQPGQEEDATTADAEPREPGQLTPEEARMLLDSLRQLDKVLPIRPPEQRNLPAVRKDW